MFGYAGKILHVNLTTRKTNSVELKEEFCKKYIGGRGFATGLLYENSNPNVDPLSPENTMVLSTGPFAVTPMAIGDKFAVGAKSPLTGFIGESLGGSFWSRELKKAGWDTLIIRGRAEKPTYMFIDDDIVEFRDAKSLWGKSPWKVDDLIREELGDESIRVTSIGLAGENMVRFANITNDMRTCGRTGMGAVMGSKNLKAIATRGTKTIFVANLDKLWEVALEFYQKARGPETEKYRVVGTPVNVLVLNRLGILPTKNWQQSTFEGVETVSGEHMLKYYVTNITACSSCPIACDHNVTVKEGLYAGTTTSIDYESMYALGPNCGIGAPDPLLKAIELCDVYGLDTISAGVVVGWAMECYEKGLITKEDTDGIDLRFGNPEAIIQILGKIARREGIGDLLAEGTKIASERLGKGSEHFAIHIKGLELPGYDIRSLKTAALGWAVSANGGDHNRSGAYDYDISGKVDRFKVDESRGKLAMESEDFAAVLDSMILCKFCRRLFKNFYADVAEIYTLITGIEMKAAKLRQAGERITNMKKVFNIREGWTRANDHLPPRVMKDPVSDGMAKGSLVTQEELDFLLDSYYKARGWSKDGNPTREKLVELGLEDRAKELLKR